MPSYIHLQLLGFLSGQRCPCSGRIYAQKWATGSPTNGWLGGHSSCADAGSCPRPPRQALTSLTSTLLCPDLRRLLSLRLSEHLLSQASVWLTWLCNLGDEVQSQRLFLERLTPGGLPSPPPFGTYISKATLQVSSQQSTSLSLSPVSGMMGL